MEPVASLNTAWFALIGVLWAGYFFLEGFDFGVGILSPVLSRDDLDRRLCINTVGPVWDANEVWLIVAGGATFAAFPVWYSTMFSAFYLALFIILGALIFRGLAFEFRGKGRRPEWRRAWDRCLFWGSLVPAFLWGVAFTDLVRGVPIVGGPRYVGGFWGLVHPVAVLGGLATLAVFSLHGAIFLALKTTGELAGRARRAAEILALPAIALVAGVVIWVGVDVAGQPRPQGLSEAVPIALSAACVAALAGAGWLVARRRDLLAFVSNGVAILALTATAFTQLFPRVMVSSRAPAASLTIWNAASEHNTLVVMTVVAAIFIPLVLIYQGWSYWVFRQRLGREPMGAGSPDDGAPAAPTVASPGGSAQAPAGS